MKSFDPSSVTHLRKSNHMNISQFARLIGVDRQLIHNIEAKYNCPNVATLCKIADKFNLPIDFFFTEPKPSKRHRESIEAR